MTAFFSDLILGVVQGITEWLPVSSEGINTLILLHFFHKPLSEAIRLSIWLHTGTLLAALVYFRRDVVELLRYLPRYLRGLGGGSQTERDRLTTFLVVSTVCSAVIGAPLMVFGLSQWEIPTGWVIAVIGIFLIVTGLVQRYARRSSGTKTTAGIKDAVLLGVVQAFSVIPGLSRSGITVSALLFRGYEARAAMRLSFLMSIPVVLVAGVGLGLLGGASFDLPALGGIAAAFVFGLLTIGALLRLANRIPFWQFCLFLGGVSLLPLLLEAFS